MQPFSRSIFDLFDGKKRYVVPLFQRQYVWNLEDQWEPLWEDIRRKHQDQVKQRVGPPHFLGAMVIDQKKVFGNQVPTHLVIDGQQRLTTFQIFLAAFRDRCAEMDLATYRDECDRYLVNTGIMANAEEERYEVWPSNFDRDQLKGIIDSKSRGEVERRFPPIRRKWARKPDPRPNMIECYLYFHDQIGEHLETEHLDIKLEQRVAKLFETLQGSLKVVTIELEGNDDPQVIFETLNARGAPLQASDLLRNFIFWRATQRNENQEKLYQTYWLPFDEQFWREEEKQGRLLRPRLDLFMQHYLAFRRQEDINIGHLFAEYKQWITVSQPFSSVEEELQELVQHRGFFRKLVDPEHGSSLGRLANTLKIFDTRTIYPLLLGILDRGLPDQILNELWEDLGSYIVRRAVCGFTAKGYNLIFVSILAKLPKDLTRSNFRAILHEMQGESRVWPRDEDFREAWLEMPSYDNMLAARIQLILREIEDHLRKPKSEVIDIKSDLTIEHVLPQGWIENWPLPNTHPGVPFFSRINGNADPADIKESARRDKLMHSFGNLTLVTQPLNSALQNAPYQDKRPAILENSALALNRYFQNLDSWDEVSILKRGAELFEAAKTIWPFGN